MSCIHHNFGLFDVRDEEYYGIEPLILDAYYVPDASATNATTRQIAMMMQTKKAPLPKGRGRSPVTEGYEPLYKMFSNMKVSTNKQKGIKRAVSQLTSAVNDVNRKMKTPFRVTRSRAR
jgi:hypothetical protein